MTTFQVDRQEVSGQIGGNVLSRLKGEEELDLQVLSLAIGH